MIQEPFKTVLIDDESPAIQRLLELTAHFPAVFDIVGSASGVNEAIKLINEIKPDLIFLDIQMPVMTGFEMLKKLERIPLIIFCTAYDHYSLKAFETNSIDYLMKPVKLERLSQTVEKLGKLKNEFSSDKVLQMLENISLLAPRKTMTSITIRIGDKMVFVKLDDVAYFKADDKYVSLFTNNGKEMITDQTLAQLEEKLPDNFLRVQRSVLLNKNYVQEVQAYFNCRYIIVLSDREQTLITTGRSFQIEIKRWLDI
jgi:two-component system LytT family response regulator